MFRLRTSIFPCNSISALNNILSSTDISPKWFNVLNATVSLVLSAPPYNFPSSFVGLSYLSPLLGTLLSALYTGPLGRYIVLRPARSNAGIVEPEHRL